jgi:hypothetical protein
MRAGTLRLIGPFALAAVLASCASNPDPEYSPSYSSGEPNWRARPSYGTVTLRSGFTPDPEMRAIQAGGRDEVRTMLSGEQCRGYIHAAAPDLDLNYTAGDYQLVIYAKSDTDITLVVNDATGRWWCSDDVSGTNPAIYFRNPTSGNYNIWIGTYRPSGTPLPESVLYISEMEPRW